METQSTDAAQDKTAQEQGKPSLQDDLKRPGFIFWAGVFVGLLLTAVGPFSSSAIGAVPARLLFCSGLGIVFGAFGSTATIRFKGVVVAGVAAIAIALLYVVDGIMRESFATIEIRGNVDGAILHFDNEKSYGMDAGNRQEFVFLGPAIKRRHVSLEVTLPADTTGAESVLLFECIGKGEIETNFGSGNVIQWKLNASQGTLTRDGKIIARDNEDCDNSTAPSTVGSALRSLLPVNVAFAAQETQALDPLFRNLESNSTAIRRGARAKLGALGVDGVSPLLKRFAHQPISYRMRLGIVVALTDIMRKNKAHRAEIAAAISPQDFSRLVDAAADRDRTIRIYASEFLYDLGDARVIDLAFAKIPRTDDNGRYNLVLVIGGARPSLPSTQKATVDRRLMRLTATSGPRTKMLIDSVVAGKPAARPS